MSNYCDCCSTDEQWVEEHLDWDIDPLVDIRKQAQECFKYWNQECFKYWNLDCKDPLECSVEDLDRLFRNIIYRNSQSAL